MSRPSPTVSPEVRASGQTPMLKQYHALKSQYSDCILFFRLGDFYEMFYEDAQVASRILDLVLTSRGKDPATKVPMCGIPHHAAENYIAKLIKEGLKVAICDQVEDVGASKGIVKRDVTRIITSGTYLDEQNKDSRYLLVLSPQKQNMGLAFIDPASGTILTNTYPADPKLLIEKIAHLPIFECVYPEHAKDQFDALSHHPLLQSKKITYSAFDDWTFNLEMTKKTLCDHFSVANLHGFGLEDKPAAASACGALLEYLKYMNKSDVQHVDRISIYHDAAYCTISAAACRGLELDALIQSLNQTHTSMGKRLFRYWLLHPLKSKQDIETRQNAVTTLTQESDVTAEIKNLLSHMTDMEKHISRLSCGYMHAKDLLAIRRGLSLLPDLQKILQPFEKQNVYFEFEDIVKLRQHLMRAVNEEIPLSKPEGHVIQKGFHPQLDELRGLQENGRAWLKDYQEKETKRTHIPSLKVGFNRVFGYYIEITKTHAQKVPDNYMRKQTLANAERYITPELKEYEEKILTAQEKIAKIETELMQGLVQEILKYSRSLHSYCDALAALDCLVALHDLALRPKYCLPKITDDIVLDLKEGRHPLVEQTSTDTFIANDTRLDHQDQHLIILTGPNMSGKSTYIRQTALLVILAQVGSYIPADSATVGIVDKIFTRIGAHDDISKGQSTFMVEMNETADILNNLTERSLVILDEIGRGTSTYDGLSLAWALAQHFAELRVRTLFATHFHECTALAEQYPGVQNYNVAVKKWEDSIVFLHKIIPGSTDDSYGIYVARLAGIPNEVTTQAKQILTQLELKNNIKENLKQNLHSEEQLSLFQAQTDPTLEEIKETLEKIDINTLTPIEALNKLQTLKNKLSEA